jgi:hypothetical protein
MMLTIEIKVIPSLEKGTPEDGYHLAYHKVVVATTYCCTGKDFPWRQVLAPQHMLLRVTK